MRDPGRARGWNAHRDCGMIPSLSDSPFDYYFAYGSNMSTRRLRARIPSAVPVGAARIDDRQLVFDKVARDGSGKANLAARKGESAWGVVHRIATGDWARLDGFEPGYERSACSVRQMGGERLEAQIYLATGKGRETPPLAWYLAHLLEGAREHDLPDFCIATLEQIRCLPSREE